MSRNCGLEMRHRSGTIVTYVGILVDGAGDETGDIVSCAEDLRERVGEGWSSLDGGKVKHSCVVPVGQTSNNEDLRVGETKHIFYLADRQGLGHEYDVSVESASGYQHMIDPYYVHVPLVGEV